MPRLRAGLFFISASRHGSIFFFGSRYAHTVEDAVGEFVKADVVVFDDAEEVADLGLHPHHLRGEELGESLAYFVNEFLTDGPFPRLHH